MSEERPVVRKVAWREVFPWLILFRVFRTAISPSLLLLALGGVLAAPIGWSLARWTFLDTQQLERDPAFAAAVRRNSSWPAPESLTAGALRQPDWPQSFVPGLGVALAAEATTTFAAIPRQLVEPFRQLLNTELSVTRIAYFLFGGLWTLLVWSCFGGAITRAAVVRLGREERLGLSEIVQYSGRRLGHYFAAPLFPLLGLVFFAFLLLPLGWLMLADWGVLVAGLFWFVVLLLGFFAAVLLLGLLFGWPLMWAAISAEPRGDAFDALSRSYAYTFQRPWHYFFYAIVALVVGEAGWLLVQIMTEGVIGLSYWLVSWGADVQQLWSADAHRLASIRDAVSGGVKEIPASLLLGAIFINLWETLLRLLATAFPYCYFWCASSAIYLLLRYHVDETEFDEIYLPEQSEQPLPPLPADEADSPSGAAADQPEDGGSAATGGSGEERP